MKIDKVIFCVDDNPHYRGFWKSISRHFCERMGMASKLFVIANRDTATEYPTEFGEVEYVPPVPGVPSIIQALMGKFYYTTSEPMTTWMVGDLDLYPLQRRHFVDTIADIDDAMYVHLNPHAYGRNWRKTVHGLAGYYHVAKGVVFSKALGFHRPFADVVEEVYRANRYGVKFHNCPVSELSKHTTPDYGWFCCEEMYTGHLLRDYANLIELPPTGRYLRVDRAYGEYTLSQVLAGQYIDFHAPRPYEEYAIAIEHLIAMPFAAAPAHEGVAA
jgi:hypothetical protein